MNTGKSKKNVCVNISKNENIFCFIYNVQRNLLYQTKYVITT